MSFRGAQRRGYARRESVNQQILRYVRNNNIFIQMKNAVMRENSGILCANEAISSVLFGDR
ncbi:MAG: hypothetical protein ACREOI_35455, partial [bacterium]